MNRAIFFGASILMTLCAAPTLASTMVSVPATSDLYLAGQPIGTHCCGGDNAPTESPVLASITLSADQFLTFSTTGGAAHEPSETVSPTADGDTSFTYNLTADYGTGISGPTNVHLNGLAGLFVGPGVPGGPAPSQLSGTAFSALSPSLDQIFFIGDGLTGTGSGDVQKFYVPAGATGLYLGIIDDGGYYDNHGSIIATISSSSAVPEPESWALMIGGIGVAGGVIRRARRKSEDRFTKRVREIAAA